MINTDKTGMFLNFTEQELAQSLATNLEPLIEQQVQKVLDQKKEEEGKPLRMEEAADFLRVSRTTFSKLVGKGEIPFKSLNPDNPRAAKFFAKRDLQKWLKDNKTKTIDELKKVGNEGSSS